jgi:hypothetical protein
MKIVWMRPRLPCLHVEVCGGIFRQTEERKRVPGLRVFVFVAYFTVFAIYENIDVH